MRGIVKSGVYWEPNGPVRRGAIDSALEPDLLLVSRCWRGGWRPVTSASPGGSCQAALLGYVTLEHPAGITTAGQAIDGVDRLLNQSCSRYKERLRLKDSVNVTTSDPILVAMTAYTLDDVMPDGSGTCDTNDVIIHRTIVCIA